MRRPFRSYVPGGLVYLILHGLTILPSIAPGASAANCDITSVGLTPLSDMGGATYQGYPGGLYPGASSLRPATHEQAGLDEAAEVIPRDAAGFPDAEEGMIGLVTIGMSNTSMESMPFIQAAHADPEKAPRLMLVNGAQGGQTAASIAQPGAPYWLYVDQQIAAHGLSAAQIQVIWLKEANAFPQEGFPLHAEILRDQLRTIQQILRDRFPNARLCFFSSRIYAGYASSALNPEPYAYESGFAVKWLIEEQIAGNPDLNYDPDAGPVVAPWLSWAAYLWADGLVPRSDGLIWECADFAADGTHPSAQGAAKVGSLLMDWIRTDPVAASWYFVSPTGVDPLDAGALAAFRVLAIAPNPLSSSATLNLELASSLGLRVNLLDVAGRLQRRLHGGPLPAGQVDIPWDGRDVNGRSLPSGVYLLRVEDDYGARRDAKVTVLR